MKRPFILPVSAAVIGSLLAVGVFAGTRKARSLVQEQYFYAVEATEDVQVKMDGADVGVDLDGGQIVIGPDDIQVDGESLQQVMEDVRVQIRAAVESDRELTAADREKIREALQRIEAKLPFTLDLDARIEINGEKLEIRSFAEASEDQVIFELDVQAPELPAAPEPAGN